MEYIFDPAVIEKLDLTDLRPLPSNLEMRPLLKSDHQNNFLSILAQLTKVGDISKSEYDARFDQMKNSNCYFVLVVVDHDQESKIIGTATLILEQKFIRKCASKGRVEEVSPRLECSAQNVPETIKICGIPK